MLTWPKAPERIADRRNGNGSFWKNRGIDLESSIGQFRAHPPQPQVSATDLRWLETEFRDFNEANGYPLSMPLAIEASGVIEGGFTGGPNFEVTRRYKWETAQKPFRWLLAQFGQKNTTLIERRSWKRAA
jgi:hypothetical protein